MKRKTSSSKTEGQKKYSDAPKSTEFSRGKSSGKTPFKRNFEEGRERGTSSERTDRNRSSAGASKREDVSKEGFQGKPFEKKPFKRDFEEGRERGSFSDRTDREKNGPGAPKRDGASRGSFQAKPSYTKKSDEPKSKRKRTETPQLAGMPKLNHPNKPVTSKPAPKITEEVRLNKYISNAGICSRRKADELIEKGLVKVNDEVVYAMGHKVKPNDVVTYNGAKVVSEHKVYVLLNKPKDFITTTSDERGRKTVMELVKLASNGARLYPVGRLDRNTTGLLLLTNDGELAQHLSHPSTNVIKVYQAELDKPIKKSDLETIRNGVELEDGMAQVDEIDITEPQVDARFVGIAIHSGKNRIVRRIFEHLGYEVKRLDRVSYAGLTKKDLPRGKWRFLTEQELVYLKHLTAGSVKK